MILIFRQRVLSSVKITQYRYMRLHTIAKKGNNYLDAKYIAILTFFERLLPATPRQQPLSRAEDLLCALYLN